MLRFHDNKSHADKIKQLTPVKLDGWADTDILIEGDSFDTMTRRGDDLYVRIFPMNIDSGVPGSEEMLSLWEKELGIVPFADDTIETRIKHVRARLARKPNLNLNYLKELLEEYGLSVHHIAELYPMMCGIASCNDELYEEDAIYCFQVVLNGTDPPAHLDDYFEDFQSIQPAHTVGVIDFTGV